MIPIKRDTQIEHKEDVKIKRRRRNDWWMGIIITIIVVILFFAEKSTIHGINTPITSSSTGIWNYWIVWHFSEAILFLAKILGGNYGIGIIAFTIIVRLILLPSMLKQARFTKVKQKIDDRVTKIRKSYKLQDALSQLHYWIRRQKIYDSSDLQSNRSGCVMSLVQIPIIWALYQAIWRTHILRTGQFLWMQLGHQDPYFILPVLATLLTLASMAISYHYHASPQTGCSRLFLILTPIWIFVIAINVPSAIALYWVVLNAFGCLQSVLVNIDFKHKDEK